MLPQERCGVRTGRPPYESMRLAMSAYARAAGGSLVRRCRGGYRPVLMEKYLSAVSIEHPV
jgi:hypothetical protein